MKKYTLLLLLISISAHAALSTKITTCDKCQTLANEYTAAVNRLRHLDEQLKRSNLRQTNLGKRYTQQEQRVKLEENLRQAKFQYQQARRQLLAPLSWSDKLRRSMGRRIKADEERKLTQTIADVRAAEAALAQFDAGVQQYQEQLRIVSKQDQVHNELERKVNDLQQQLQDCEIQRCHKDFERTTEEENKEASIRPIAPQNPIIITKVDDVFNHLTPVAFGDIKEGRACIQVLYQPKHIQPQGRDFCQSLDKSLRLNCCRAFGSYFDAAIAHRRLHQNFERKDRVDACYKACDYKLQAWHVRYFMNGAIAYSNALRWQQALGRASKRVATLQLRLQELKRKHPMKLSHYTQKQRENLDKAEELLKEQKANLNEYYQEILQNIKPHYSANLCSPGAMQKRFLQCQDLCEHESQNTKLNIIDQVTNVMRCHAR